ncbi:hypothetical protein PF005_g2027 [Phytophthora fragariae]|uniref:Uncharacterized protein n=1 Tax=Phytophthora fragariae TaxID=53985 RepID=A0A6A3ZCZ4_9STRA|nr:hypothetical protein PF003_g1229 [Phytophthora fragariae]KAE8948330.1 hypothetical protein PF009_g2119 [Phytophthora fragariae]KAE9137539.1 hypothetical protein PF007_g1771 [Phytophthora fragariae]KAE9154422.1 hypothetical protein PF006_g1562 [Phytophthora fragariae]KAE9234164.1 hypothetical protein PF005_g2027 [Phytophthora fragariae]
MASITTYHAALLPVVAVLLHRHRPFLSCCAASSSATAPMASIATVSCCSATVLLPITRLHEC